ncbi:MAG: IS110 family transposase [Gammaproteobacteria bacterium]|nr:IS110 family transposase [Gammaproteobacteria bacterium]MDH5629372.1 IS110 family transposase [Gammaproteobacteria bacterium]
MTYFIGIDVAKDKLDCLWLRDIESLKIKTKVLPNSAKGFNDLKLWFEKNVSSDLSLIHVCLEATGVYHEALAYALFEMGVKVSVVNPAFIRDFAKGLGVRSKTDKKDSMVLARYCALTSPRLWEPESVDIRKLKALLARLAGLNKDLQRESNRLEKASISQASTAVIESHKLIIEQLQKEIERMKKQIEDDVDQNPDIKNNRELLKTIPGIGEVLSLEMLAVLKSRCFVKASQAAAFIGVVPKLWESGKMKGRTTLCKNGSARLRSILYMAAIVATKYNPDINAQYERLLAAGKTKMQALGAAMRKLVQICFGVLKHQSEYRPQIC